MVRLAWLRHRGRHGRLSEISDEVARNRRDIDQMRNAITAVCGPDPGPGEAVPPELAAALAAGHRDGKAVVLDVGGEEVIAVVGDGGDPAAVWGAVRKIAS